MTEPIVSPYRHPGEKEPEPPKKRSWEWLYAVAGILVFFVVFPGLLFLGQSCDQKRKQDRNAGQCRIEEANNSFKIVKYDNNGDGKVQAYLTFRNEAEQYLDQLDGCKEKIK